MIGVNPNYDYLLDPQQEVRQPREERCSLCGGRIYCGNSIYTLGLNRGMRDRLGSDRLIVCQCCLEEIQESHQILEEDTNV